MVFDVLFGAGGGDEHTNPGEDAGRERLVETNHYVSGVKIGMDEVVHN